MLNEYVIRWVGHGFFFLVMFVVAQSCNVSVWTNKSTTRTTQVHLHTRHLFIVPIQILVYIAELKQYDQIESQ